MKLDTIVVGDCLKVMAEMPDECVDLTVTSPPYDTIRTCYEYEFDFEAMTYELYRITKLGSIVVWVVADKTKDFCESLTSFKQAIYFVDICGFNLLDTMIYYKANYAPAYPTMRRYANQFEYMFVFSKGRPKNFTPVQKRKVRNKREKAAFRQEDGSLKRKIKDKGRETKDASNVWEFAVAGNLIEHPAVFPEQLTRDHILTWTNLNELVFDPMIGSGTTAVAAIKLSRHFYGCDISAEYIELANKRIKGAQAQPMLPGIMESKAIQMELL